MKKIFALVEHRKGEIRDITYELLTKGRDLASKLQGDHVQNGAPNPQRGGNDWEQAKQSCQLTALLLGNNISQFAEKLKSYAHHIVTVDHEVLKDFNAESYQIVLSDILKKESPWLTLIGHTASGMDLAPSLAQELGTPLATDCMGIDVENDNLIATRQMYGGKLNARCKMLQADSYILTTRQAAFPQEPANLNADIVAFPSPLTQEPDYRKFVEYLEAAVGEVDITKADIVIGIGRGIKERDNLSLVEELADSLGGVLACSRPIVDADWLPKDRQVGSSGKTIKPKLYIAIGISGQFQHITGMKGADTILAINKDPNAPIFNEADYGIVDDLFKVVPALKSKIAEIKS